MCNIPIIPTNKRTENFLREKIINDIFRMKEAKMLFLHIKVMHLDDPIDGSEITIDGGVHLHKNRTVTHIAWLSIKPKTLLLIREAIKRNDFFGYMSINTVSDGNKVKDGYMINVNSVDHHGMKVRFKRDLKVNI